MSFVGAHFPFEAAAGIEIVVFDVDGVLTDGKIRIDDHGREIKAFDVRDGHGIKLLQRAGVQAAILTGRESDVVRHRAAELGISYVRQRCLDKAAGLAALLEEAGIAPEKAAFFGDDVIDLPAMRLCRLSFAPADAHPAVRKHADWISDFAGGKGAVRQMAEALILARGAWDRVMRKRYGISPEDCGWPTIGA